MKPNTDRRNIVRFCLLWTLFAVSGSMAYSSKFDSQIEAKSRLYWFASDQQQNQEGSTTVEINHDLIFSPDSPLRSANQKPVEVKFNLPGLGETIATISKFDFKNDQ